MATELVDVINTVSAVPVPDDIKCLHNIEQVGQQTCRGGINVDNVVKLVCADYGPKYFDSSYLSSLPDGFKEFDMGRADQCIQHLRLTQHILVNVQYNSIQ